MPVSSARSPISPPRASISRTRWPLARPPMAGLQLIWAIVSRWIVTRQVRRPMALAAAAASQPAWPPPTTTTSTSLADLAGLLFSDAEAVEDLREDLFGPNLSRELPDQAERRP